MIEIDFIEDGNSGYYNQLIVEALTEKIQVERTRKIE